MPKGCCFRIPDIVNNWDKVDVRIKGTIGRVYYKLCTDKDQNGRTAIEDVKFEKKINGIACYKKIL